MADQLVYARALLELGRVTEGLALAEKISANAGDDLACRAGALLLAGRAYRLLGDLDRSYAIWQDALATATEEGLVEALKEQLRRGVVASIGPVCSEALRAEGLPPDIEPDHPKMGHLVKAAAERAATILHGKQ